MTVLIVASCAAFAVVLGSEVVIAILQRWR